MSLPLSLEDGPQGFKVPSAWRLLVCVRCIVICFVDKAVGLAISVPLVAARDTSSATIECGLYDLAQIRDIEATTRELVALAPKNTQQFGFDEAAPNENVFRGAGRKGE